MSKILNQDFYKQNTLVVAKKLLGKILVRKIKNKIIRGIITETEAYRGSGDLASHASRGRTPRTELMFGPPGYSYVYLVYGMYYCFNIITEKTDYPAAVLVRAIKIKNINYQKTNGPGKLCRFLKIDKSLNGVNLTFKNNLWLEKSDLKIRSSWIIKTPRIGVDYAKQYRDKKWRFYIDINKI